MAQSKQKQKPKPDQRRMFSNAVPNITDVDKLPVIDGPFLYGFDAKKLSLALEQECERARIMGWPKVSLHMDVVDALKLAKALKRVG